MKKGTIKREDVEGVTVGRSMESLNRDFSEM
jgi:hypothetical protein